MDSVRPSRISDGLTYWHPISTGRLIFTTHFSVIKSILICGPCSCGFTGLGSSLAFLLLEANPCHVE